MALEHDHTPEQALDALLVRDEDVPGGLSRRRFLMGLGAAATVAATGFGRDWRRPAAAAGAERNLVVFLLEGGNDGFATLQPTVASALDQARANLLLDRSSLLPVGNDLGLHPALPSLHRHFGAGDVAVVGGVGASGNLSHFATMDEWMLGSATPTATGVRGTGWLGRWLDALGPATATPLRAVSLTNRVPSLLVGRATGGVGIGSTGGALFGADRSRRPAAALYSMVESAPAATGSAHALAASVAARASSLAPTVGPVRSSLPAGIGAAQGTVAGRLLNSGLGTRTVFCSIPGFDHHTDLATGQSASLAQFDAAVDALFATLDPAVASRTVALAFSEFGRRAAINGSGGTDHGHAGYAFLIGPGVRGGFHGSILDPDRLDAVGNVAPTVRHLDLIGSVLGGWLGADAGAIVGGAPTDLGLFA